MKIFYLKHAQSDVRKGRRVIESRTPGHLNWDETWSIIIEITFLKLIISKE